MDYKEAIEYLKEPIDKPLEVHDKAIKLAIKALETQEETTGKLEDFREWILVNYEPAIVDLVAITVVSHGKVNGWDEIAVDEMLDELHYELKEGLLNVIDTFLKD